LAEPRELEISVDGRPVRFQAGQSLAAAMLSAEILAWRRTRHADDERGLFCGIGVCFDCLVTVNGVTSVRACVSAARDGDVVTTAPEGQGRDDGCVDDAS
jgi:predicted molibdopterin-dependent oxidoreductase YjgC